MPRYVILRHEMPASAHRPDHWDLMLESHEVLATWALTAPPAPDAEVVAARLADHRCDYLDYEGPVSGDRGTVTRWDAGQYAWVSQSSSTWVAAVHGERLVGQLVLQVAADRPGCWTVRYSARKSPPAARRDTQIDRE